MVKVIVRLANTNRQNFPYPQPLTSNHIQLHLVSVIIQRFQFQCLKSSNGIIIKTCCDIDLLITKGKRRECSNIECASNQMSRKNETGKKRINLINFAKTLSLWIFRSHVGDSTDKIQYSIICLQNISHLCISCNEKQIGFLHPFP